MSNTRYKCWFEKDPYRYQDINTNSSKKAAREFVENNIFFFDPIETKYFLDISSTEGRALGVIVCVQNIHTTEINKFFTTFSFNIHIQES